MMATAARMRKGMSPDAAWCISLIYTLRPSHPIFAKDYVAPSKKKAKAQEASCLDNSSGFFDNLPLSKSRKKGRGALGTRRLTKVEREQQRITQLQERLA